MNMKKMLLIIFMCTIFGVVQTPCAFAQTAGVITEVSGTVEIKLPGAASFAAAKIGDQLTQDTVIATSFKSFAVIQIGSALITVRPITNLTLSAIQASAETETLNVSLQSGRVKLDVKPPTGTRAAASIVSPSAVASVRGTSFEFDTRNLYVYEGTVAFIGKRGQEMQVGAGSASRVEADDRAVPPMQMKIGAILPPSPVGSDIAGIIAAGPVRKGVIFMIELTFEGK